MIREDIPTNSYCVKWRTGACSREPFAEHEGKGYCVLHFPEPDKKEAFEIAFKEKLDAHDSNYEGVWFPEGNWFTGLTIQTSLDFQHSFFHGRTSFYKTTFRSEVNFKGVTFDEDAGFEYATFAKQVDFSSGKFKKQANFHNTRFEGYANFWRCTFTERVDFSYAIFLNTASFWPSTFKATVSFSNASFAKANFAASEFHGQAGFSWCAFGLAEFIGTSFKEDANFFNSRFEGMSNFAGAKFETTVQFQMSEFNGEARFTSAAFNGNTDFSYALFKDYVSFSGEHGIGGFAAEASCDFRNARFESPKRVSFHSVTLWPHWFVNVDPREFQFIDVKWIAWLATEFIDRAVSELISRAEREEKLAADRRAERLREAIQFHDEVAVQDLKKEEAEAHAWANNPHDKSRRFYRLLSIACRQLAVSAEENHQYDQASNLRFWSMEVQRKERWTSRGRIVSILHFLYRYLSGYGERIGLALAWLLGIWLLFAVLYTQIGFARPHHQHP